MHKLIGLTDVVGQSDQQHWQACLPYTEAIKKVMLSSPWCLQNWLVEPQLLDPQWFAQAYDKAKRKKNCACT